MAGIMVSASTGVMNSLLGKLTTLMGEEFAKLKNLRKEVKHIIDELSSMKGALESLADLDELDIQTTRWRDEVREMSYDIEDIIDDFMCKVGEKNKKSGFVQDTIQRLKTSRARHRIASQIEDIKKLVRETSERRERYKLDVPKLRNVAIDQRVVALYENAAKLVGIEGPTKELFSWLIDKEKKLKVVSIVGFGGLGKTTLANEVYRKLKGGFNCGAFVPVSQKPNIPKLLHSLLTQLGCGQPFHDCELNVLLDQLRENLEEKSYLVVIDDLWDVSAWNIIKCAFPENEHGYFSLKKLVQVNSKMFQWRFSRNVVVLCLTVDKLDKDDVGILAELPVLIDLRVTLDRALEETITIYGTAFALLKRFEVTWNIMPLLTFQAGAMPNLQSFSLQFNARGWKLDDKAAPTETRAHEPTTSSWE
ncbi:hypothetical protein ZWY2020_026436 [Hordeum vulgare]|nr:hypothetical protein ZWY2020_026436 [Hordeum vulgare]